MLSCFCTLLDRLHCRFGFLSILESCIFSSISLSYFLYIHEFLFFNLYKKKKLIYITWWVFLSDRYLFEKDFVCTTISIADRGKLCKSVYRKLRENGYTLLRTKDAKLEDVELNEKEMVCDKKHIKCQRKDKPDIIITQKVLPCVFNEKGTTNADDSKNKKSDRLYLSRAYVQTDSTKRYVLVYRSDFNEFNVEMALDLIKRTDPGIAQEEFGQKKPTAPVNPSSTP